MTLVAPPFVRAQFQPIVSTDTHDTQGEAIRGLPDLIRFNTKENPDHTFCIQAESRGHADDASENRSIFRLRKISFRELSAAVDTCALWLEKAFPDQCSIARSGIASKHIKPIALYIESDVGLFIHLAALLALNVPTVLLSARLNVASVRHLLSVTETSSILVSRRTERVLAQSVADIATIKLANTYSTFLDSVDAFLAPPNVCGRRAEYDEYDLTGLILHSSGTTGLPKPIHLARRYLLGYAACHSFKTTEEVSSPNLSTLPMYHGFGLLAPCLSLSVGMTCCFPPSSIIPAAHSMLDLMNLIKARGLMTVPSVLEDITNMPEDAFDQALPNLKALDFVASGGGPLKLAVAETLAEKGIRLLNHYGATEIGAIAPIFRPGPDYDWHYLRLRTDMGLYLRPLLSDVSSEHVQRFRLVGTPLGWREEFEIQDEMVMRPDSQHVEIRILGRSDDVIVLKTGEKALPRLFEETLSRDPAIKTAVCVGSGRFELAILVEPSILTTMEPAQLKEHVWKIVSAVNAMMDSHAQISSDNAIIDIRNSGKAIPRSDKGSVMRKEVHEVFEKEIDAAYAAMEVATTDATRLDVSDQVLEQDLAILVRKILGQEFDGEDLEPESDLFELGMNSLQATRLARLIKASITLSSPGKQIKGDISAKFIYQHPSINKLCTALRLIINLDYHETDSATDRGHQLRSMLERYTKVLDLGPKDTDCVDQLQDTVTDRGRSVVLLTGSTGNLGAHTLGLLARSPHVSKIICLNRCAARKTGEQTAEVLSQRQEHANALAGVKLTAAEWDKVELIAANMQAENLGLSESQQADLKQRITHIVHLAWPMDFNRSLSSFQPQLNSLVFLVNLARASHRARPNVVPKLLLASSISVTRNHKTQIGSSLVLEQPIQDPLVTAPMGYAEAKWVCEHMLMHSWQNHHAEVSPIVVRIGQISGPTSDGIWKTEEHIPTLVKASQAIGAFPALSGTYSWIPVDYAANAVIDILLHAKSFDPKTPPPPTSLKSRSPTTVQSPFYHLENPIRQPLSDLSMHVISALHLDPQPMPFKTWLSKLAATGDAASLHDFFHNDFLDLAAGAAVLDTSASRRVSRTLRGCSGLDADVITEYVRRWQKDGFLK